MNPLYSINYFIFAIFLTLFMFEVGIALLSLAFYNQYRDRIRKYLLPIWEVDGTFAALYLVNFEVTYPTLLGFVGSVYIFPLLTAAAFFLIRSAFLVYSEYIGVERERRYVKMYAVSTLIVSFLAISVLNSGVSGIGINIANNSVDLLGLLLNPFNILMFGAIELIAVFMTSNYFEVERLNRLSIFYLVIAFIIIAFSLYWYVPSVFANLVSNIYLPIISIALATIAVIAYLMRLRYANYLAILWLFASINLFGIAEYPYIFGTQNISTFLASSAISTAAVWITIVGGILIAVSLAYLVYVTQIKKQE